MHILTKSNFSGFDWDGGNWPKCGKHGVSQAEIGEIFQGAPAVMPDPHPRESRLRAIGKTCTGRYVFLVYTVRPVSGRKLIRPISARYMHGAEVDHYESSTSEKDSAPAE
ncbi:MAG: BrnT family toxin [Steroidobacteraceae bacterium]